MVSVFGAVVGLLDAVLIAPKVGRHRGSGRNWRGWLYFSTRFGGTLKASKLVYQLKQERLVWEKFGYDLVNKVWYSSMHKQNYGSMTGQWELVRGAVGG